tara:strand:+ start:362 stop:559 length:198 start_codon:yes stop_codon:yes gene_type:complete
VLKSGAFRQSGAPFARLKQGTALENRRNIVASVDLEPKGSIILGDTPFSAVARKLSNVFKLLILL